MQNQEWAPGHSTNKGYPYNAILSRTLFSNRPTINQDKENKVVITDSRPDIFGAIENAEQEREFLLHRLHDFNQALDTAEMQIEAILTENPFVPEDFGFELAHKPESIHDSPIRVYVSKYVEGVSIYREIQDPSDPKSDPSKWVVMVKEEEPYNGKVGDTLTKTVFRPTRVKLDCHRIAYAVFYALGVQVEPLQNEAATPPAPEGEAPGNQLEMDLGVEKKEGAGTLCAHGDIGDQSEHKESEEKEAETETQGGSRYNALYASQYGSIQLGKILALNEEDARTKALFMLQTQEFGVKVPENIDLKDISLKPVE